MKVLIQHCVAILFIFAGSLANAAILHPTWGMAPGQGIYSDDGRYLLLMQGDGNLVYYRTQNWSVRWASYTNGTNSNYTLMQSDGNLVIYTPAWSPTWNTRTQNHPGAYLAAQNDGNLVVYWNGQALWNIGTDPETQKPEPRIAGDIVGREMENGIPLLGHVGFYDGKNIYEVLNDGAQNAVAHNSLSEFKRRAYNGYWGAGYPNVPNFYVKSCFKIDCRDGDYNSMYTARDAMTLRAYQILLIGSSYTYTAISTMALPSNTSRGRQRGSYRCDTYVLDIYRGGYGNIADANGWMLNVAAMPANSSLRRWIDFTNNHLPLGITPPTIFNKLKNFAG